MELRQRRIENEWELLQQLAQANPALLSDIQRHQDDFLLKLSQTTAPVRMDENIDLRSEHDVRLSFPRFFPTMPIEAYVTPPVFHPNVHPDTGFVCLWNRFSLHDTVVEALCQLQRVLTFTLFSESADHVMQPEALEWAEKECSEDKLNFKLLALEKIPGYKAESLRTKGHRKRLSSISEQH
jgi:ubiquitin-protein ligase